MLNKKYRYEFANIQTNEFPTDKWKTQPDRKMTLSQGQINTCKIENYFTDSQIKKILHIKTKTINDFESNKERFTLSSYQTQRRNLSPQNQDRITEPTINTVVGQTKMMTKQRSSSNKFNEQTITSVSKKSTQASINQRKIMSAKLNLSPQIFSTQNKTGKRRQTTLNLQTFIEEKLNNNNNYNYQNDLKILQKEFKETLELQQVLVDESSKNQNILKKKYETNHKNDYSLEESSWDTVNFLLTKTLQEVETEHLLPYLNEFRTQKNGQTSMRSKDNCIYNILNILNSSIKQIITQVSKNSDQLTLLFSNIWRTFIYLVDIILQKCDQERQYAIETHFKHVQTELEEKKKENVKIINDYYNIHEQYLILQKETQTNTTVLQAKLHALKTEFDEYIFQQEEIANLDYASGVMKEMGLQIKAITLTIKKMEEGIQERDTAMNKSMKSVIEHYKMQKLAKS